MQYAVDHDIDVADCAVVGHPAICLRQGDDRMVAVDFRRIESDGDRAAILGHELGHLETGALNGANDFTPPSKNERKATAWEIRKLIPKEELLIQMGNCQGRTWEIAEAMGLPEALVHLAIEYYRIKQ